MATTTRTREFAGRRWRRWSRVTAVIGALAWVSPAPAQPPQQPLYKAGSTSRRVTPGRGYNWRGAKTTQLLTQVWYPTTSISAAPAQWLGPPESPWFHLGDWFEDAPAASGRFPLVLLSHGTGGSAAMLGWLAQSLAQHGYIVAAVNHPGNNALEPYTIDGFLLWWERARDVSAVIDFLLTDRDFSRRIDPSRIGAAGFSLGGYTVLVLAGARTDPQLLRTYCRGRAVGICADPAEFPGLYARWDELEKTSPAFRQASSRAGAAYRDPRIRAVFALAPAVVPALVPDGLRRVSTPVALAVGQADAVADYASNAQLIADQIRGVASSVLAGAGHYTFLAACTVSGSASRSDLCSDGVGVDRRSVHDKTAQLAIEFFGRALTAAR